MFTSCVNFLLCIRECSKYAHPAAFCRRHRQGSTGAFFGEKPKMEFDIYDILQEPEGNWIVTKNGEFFLNVSGGKAEAERIAKVLREEEGRAHAEVQPGKHVERHAGKNR